MAKRKSLQMNAREMSNTLTSSDEGFSQKKVFLPMMQVVYCRLSACAETPKHFSTQHFMTVHLNHDPAVKELKLNGCLQRGSFGAGDICLTPAATPVSSIRIQEPSELVALYIEPTFFVQTSAEIVDTKGLELIPQFQLKDPLIHQMAIALKAQIESSEEIWNRLYLESMVTAICVHLLQRYSTQKTNADTRTAKLSSDGLSKAHLGTVLEYIHEYADQNLSLLEMAQQVQMSPYYFSRLFKQSTGLSPHQYLIAHRIQQTKRLLTTTKLSIAEIAAQAGFTDQSHLARHFKRQLGVTPSQFR
ncbi:helix-turn-helix domain-containing protein [Halotia branconii]|uniref:AraC family transcriptional regulator n=1 Tax=Halotia branconii CENA392 TaxID=1539056 RepID=A0AAJ6NUH0_9CYAN|nr:AraC family transcriptional regulator [Halotia branconii]WGV26857.1 AraC family transcriptional regulator [Halotia branconii CENA392]